MQFPKTPAPPYYVAIFTSLRSSVEEDYGETNDYLMNKVQEMPGFLGVESWRNEEAYGVTIVYFETLENLKTWRELEEHQDAQQKGREKWYTHYKVRVAKVERDYGFDS